MSRTLMYKITSWLQLNQCLSNHDPNLRASGIQIVDDILQGTVVRVVHKKYGCLFAYLVDGQGMILPSCYVDSKAVEQVFRHPSRFMMSLARKIENDVEIQLGVADRVSMTDQEILTQLGDLLRNEFLKESLSELSMEQRIRLCLLLKRNFRAGIKQIARITRLDPETVAKVV